MICAKQSQSVEQPLFFVHHGSGMNANNFNWGESRCHFITFEANATPDTSIDSSQVLCDAHHLSTGQMCRLKSRLNMSLGAII